ncbi:MAG: type 1 glutamine amidotransferase domain-containing protein [Ketobacteraceae bacterium]|nr:type 1 glutamine amidotransferase domain-containing protein [Ketobacteraceae bacterium]
MSKLNGKKVAILATDGFEQVELTDPKKAIEEAGGIAHIVSLEPGTIRGFNHFEAASEFTVDTTVDAVNATDYDGLVLPGGVHNPDTLRANTQAVRFVGDFFQEGKPVAAICHGPWMLVEAGVVENRKLTSYHSIKTDIKNAGGQWVDQEVVVDDGLVTSRHPGDLQSFCKKLVEEIAEGQHERVTA